MPCVHCHADIPSGSRFCPGCGRAAEGASVATALADAATHLASDDSDVTRLASTPRPTSDSGWLHSSGSIDHGRFSPGTVLDNRYRVIGLLGRGGMGEVYRADDLRLGQQVALKFLPLDLSRDPVRLAQFHNEVRTARQVSHANVCRVYDIGEIDGQLFLTMEYVDGEDLSILLRRIGRLPEDKGLEISRQICAGLAAAHERGVLHRDLKPANIMLDGAGRVRIMDFSLAAAGGEVKDIRAGTPAYMAPEQLGGQEVTVRSDIYALGLVLYELFTGRRAFQAKTLTELVEQHQSGTITAPTMIVKSLDPAIEKAIVRCLDPEPARRPGSAIAVSASMPGGDPLAAALAAGETPSPEMVAAAGGDQAAMTTANGVMWMALAAALIGVAVWTAARASLLTRIPPIKPPAVLADRAEQLRESFGYTDPVGDRAFDFSYYQAYLAWAAGNGSGLPRWTALASDRAPAVRFWYRTSPHPMIPFSSTGGVVMGDPPLQATGMTLVLLDTSGHLLRFAASPPQAEGPPPPTPSHVDWPRLFAAAGLDPSTIKETTPSQTPDTYADERRAWQGPLPGTNTVIHIEAAAYRGKPVLFDVIGPWSRATRDLAPQSAANANAISIYLLLAGAGWVAWRNVRRGRADQRGGFRLAVFTVLLSVAIWLVRPHVIGMKAEQDRFFDQAGLAFFIGLAMYVIYLGLEPFVRRAWPSMLVGWSRLLSGRIRDPLIGRDLAVGVACGAAYALLTLSQTVLPPMFGFSAPLPNTPEFGALMGVRGYVLTLLGCVNISIQNGLITLFEFASLRAVIELVLRKAESAAAKRWTWAAAHKMSETGRERVFLMLATMLIAIISVSDRNQSGLDALYQALSISIAIVLLVRIGLFASLIMFFTSYVLLRTPFTLDGTAFYAGAGWFAIAGLMTLAITGFQLARRPRTALD